MSRKNRHEERMRSEQDTVGAQRAERKELEEMTGNKKIESTMRRKLPPEEGPTAAIRPRRVARVGKPLKR